MLSALEIGVLGAPCLLMVLSTARLMEQSSTEEDQVLASQAGPSLREACHGDASGAVLPRPLRGPELHPGGRALPCGSALPDAGDPTTGAGTRGRALSPGARPHAPVRAWPDRPPASGAGLPRDAGGQAPGGGFRQAQAYSFEARHHVH